MQEEAQATLEVVIFWIPMEQAQQQYSSSFT